ncbi:MAG: Maf family protein [Acidobacteriota bacterium]
MQLILASASPRRRDLLAGLGLEPVIRPVDLDETPHPGETARVYVERLAVEKAAADARAGELVLAADTVVALDGTLLGKPADANDARSMLKRLAGRAHEVSTGVAVRRLDANGAVVHKASAVATTRVAFAAMTRAEIDWYVATGEPMDKAGAYAVQGRAALFIDAVEGEYSNVVGLPLRLTYRMLRAAGYDLLERSS